LTGHEEQQAMQNFEQVTADWRRLRDAANHPDATEEQTNRAVDQASVRERRLARIPAATPSQFAEKVAFMLEADENTLTALQASVWRDAKRFAAG
jgi:hypothetical protein